jgi:NADH-quinone oxidoreductase subunit A
MYPWAVAFSDFIASGDGFGSLMVVTVFTVILLIGLLYDVKKGGLEWNK